MQVAEALEETDVRLVAVNFDTPERVARYAAAFGRGVLFLCDPDRILYARLALGRASRRRVWLHPAVWRSYARLLRNGARPTGPVADTLQLGGDVIVDRDVAVSWTYRSRGPEDRPSAADVARQAAATRR